MQPIASTTVKANAAYSPSTRHLTLGDRFFDVVEAARFPEHRLRYRNQPWAERVGLGELSADQWLDHFGRFVPLPGNLEQPLALRYHGHQFRTYNPDLGDGRGFLFAQLIDSVDGRLLDLGTKGSGRTPWSRGGDGRLTLKGGVREVLATEMLEALGVYTSKSFSMVETGEALERGDEPSPTRSCVLVRLSHSHIRFGTFQRQAALGDAEAIAALVDYCLATYMSELSANVESTGGDKAVAFFGEVVARTAVLAASWHMAGFVHGVLNTDNMNVTGESFDYGPYRFLPTFDANFVAAYFDQTGLYAFGRQPATLAWNLARLAETLCLVTEQQPLVEALQGYEAAFHAALRNKLVERLGVKSHGEDADAYLVQTVHEFLVPSQIGFERFFYDWYGGLARRDQALAGEAREKYQGYEFKRLVASLERYEPDDPARLSHPYFTRGRPCTLLIDEIESIWSRIAEADDWSAFEAKIEEIGEMRRALQVG